VEIEIQGSHGERVTGEAELHPPGPTLKFTEAEFVRVDLERLHVRLPSHVKSVGWDWIQVAAVAELPSSA
jgi:hypothetical protein